MTFGAISTKAGAVEQLILLVNIGKFVYLNCGMDMKRKLENVTELWLIFRFYYVCFAELEKEGELGKLLAPFI